jgi:hypothetical protein
MTVCVRDLFTGHVSMRTIFTGSMLPEDDKLIIIYTAGITCYWKKVCSISMIGSHFYEYEWLRTSCECFLGFSCPAGNS